MDLLNRKFVSKQVLTAGEMNDISGKIDEIVSYLNREGSDTGYSISITVGDGSTNTFYFLQSATEAVLTFAVSTRSYSKTDSSQSSDFFEDYDVKIELDRTSTGSYTTIENAFVESGKTYSINIRNYLSATRSRIRATFTGRNSGITQTWNGYAQLTTLSLSPESVGWNNPVIENQSYNFGPFTITGALDKTVYITVTGQEYSREYTENVGTRQFSKNYYFTGLQIPSAGTGVYNVEIYVKSGTLESVHYSYNLMFIAEADITTAKLVCINEPGSNLTNGSDSAYLLSYAIYSGGNTVGTIEREITWEADDVTAELVSDEITAYTGIKNTMNYALNVETGAADFDLHVFLGIDGNTVSQSYTVNNSSSYPAVTGAVFYMNPATRSNTQSNREKIVNDAARGASQKEYDATWTMTAFVDGMDGWTQDTSGRACLAVNAGSKVNIPYHPLADIGQRGRTVEILYKVTNPSDYGENVITISSNATDSEFTGLRIRPDEICLHSILLNTADTKQSYHLPDGIMVHAVISISPNYMRRQGETLEQVNLAQIFVNGVYKCEFKYDAGDTFDNGVSPSNIVFGSDTADLYVYSFRVYDNSFSADDAHTNYVASLGSTSEKENARNAYDSVLDSSGEVNIDKVKSVANYFVIEMTDVDAIPNYMWNKGDTAHSNIEMHFHDHPEDNWKIYNVETSGQGTTSMGYWRWNLRWRIDKTTTVVGSEEKKKQAYVQYWDTAIGDWQKSTTLSKNVKFDSAHKVDGNSIKVRRITAKKNYASSTQSHKMGTTAAYNDLHDAVVRPNEAGGRTAVFQVPAYGFAKYPVEGVENEYYYEFIGLFTIGPDKGDKPTFGYDQEDFENTLVTMEGLDHDKKLTVFRYPWYDNTYEGTGQVTYVKECLAIDLGASTYENGWEVGNCSTLTTDGNAQQDAQVLAYLKQEFKPAYDIAYLNSPFIMGLDPSLAENSLETINSDPTAFGLKRNENDNYRPFSHYEFYYDGEYDLYYLNIATGKYEKKKEHTNLLTDLGIDESTLSGMTLVQKDGKFRELRRERFKTAMAASDCPWNKDDALFHHVFLTIFGATDNHAKNSYPYRFLDKFCWRQDDLDTIFDTDNQGYSAKKYSVEFKDWTSDSHLAYVYKGEDSAFWTLIEQSYEVELREMGQAILEAMISKGGESAGANATTLAKLMQFFQVYYWGKAQDYFTKSAYNEDTQYTYEDAYAAGSVYSASISPLEQAHGDALENERRWVEKRMVYCMSKYRVGPFKTNTDDTSLGLITFRTQSPQNYILTPAMDLYPCMMSGTGVKYGERTWDNTPCSITSIGGGNTQIAIKAADYLRSIGDLCRLEMDPESNTSFAVSSKMLETIKIGDADRSVMYETVEGEEVYKGTNITELALQSCPSLLEIDARNEEKLASTLNLTNCPRIRRVYLKGTKVGAVSFAPGCKVTTFQLSDNISQLILKDLRFLTSVDTSGCATKINTIDISGCDHLNAFQVMYSIWNTVGNQLSTIRITDVDVLGNDNIAKMLYNISIGRDYKDDSVTYRGRDAEGTPTAAPYISGKLTFNYAVNVSYYNSIKQYYKNLEVIAEKGTDVPTEEEINLGFDKAGVNIYEDDARTPLVYKVTASNEMYRQVSWSFPSGELPGGIKISTDAKDPGFTLDLSRVQVAETNDNELSSITITAISLWNKQATATVVFTFNRVPMQSLNLKIADNSSEAISFNPPVSSTLELSYSPINTTKERFIEFVYDSSLISINSSNVVTAVEETEFTVADVFARLSIDDVIQSQTVRFYLNDFKILYSSQEGFVSLLNYIHNTLKVSESADWLTAREASKVTTIETYLRNQTSIATFNEFKYFTSLISLSSYALAGMGNCTSISLPTSLTEITGDYIFSGSGFTEIISESIIVLRRYAFRNCSSLSKVYLPNANGYNLNWFHLFQNCTTLNDVTLGSQPTVLMIEGMFEGCTSLEARSFKRAIAFVGNVTSCQSMFSGCTSLDALPPITIANLTGTAQSMFASCTSLQGVIDLRDIFGETCNTTNCASLLGNCNSITKLTLPKLPNATSLNGFIVTTSQTNTTLTEIGDIYAPSCTNISFWFVNNGYKNALVKIGNVTLGAITNAGVTWAYFRRCPNLEEIGIVDLSLAQNVQYLFDGCSKLATIGGLRIGSACTNMLNAFHDCRSINSWNTLFQDCDFSGLTNIESVFYGCTNLDAFPQGILTSKLTNTTNAFYGCSSLPSADTSQCKVFGNNMFNNCAALSGNIDLRNATSIGMGSFANCKQVSLYILPDTPPTLSAVSAFMGITGSFIVSSESVKSTYSSTTNWSSYASRFVVDASYFE